MDLLLDRKFSRRFLFPLLLLAVRASIKGFFFLALCLLDMPFFFWPVQSCIGLSFSWRQILQNTLSLLLELMVLSISITSRTDLERLPR